MLRTPAYTRGAAKKARNRAPKGAMNIHPQLCCFRARRADAEFFRCRELCVAVAALISDTFVSQTGHSPRIGGIGGSLGRLSPARNISKTDWKHFQTLVKDEKR